MKTKIKYIGLVLTLLMMSNAYAYIDLGSSSKGKKGNNDGFTSKANCAPATEHLIFQFNDVRAQLNTNGVLFLDRAAGNVAGYEVPKSESGPKLRAIYAAALWMGGTDVNNQLKIAATTFGEGNDFWTGPLSVTPGTGNYDPRNPVGHNAIRDFGAANINPDVCLEYDKYFTIRKAEVIEFITWWEWSQNPVGEVIPSPSPDVLKRIYEWPAHGDQSLGQDYYLAPFYDRAPAPGQLGNGKYDPAIDGDYPWYDDILGRDDIICGSDRRISLFGDETHWWIFNDKGNIHTSSTGEPIGMEIRAQAFAFTTNDEINKMTFYNYEMINRGTQTLQNTYFAQYVDPDLGGAFDDYVGCDVSRGLGYAFNGDNFDEEYRGNAGYGANPPAIGVDFFEGPYQDADGKDNYGPHNDTINGVITPAVMNVQTAINDKGIVYKGLGIGYNDGIIDNERFGMKRFSYYSNNSSGDQSDPSTASQFYNYMSGKWKNGADMVYGGSGILSSQGAVNVHADYMFPADSDPLNWSTAGTPTSFDWAENNADGQGHINPPGDRRFVQSAGPFTLKPGAINNITVGIVYARSIEGDLFASVRALRAADTKAQALFDNCFEILDPPNAPVLKIQELENELVLMLDNPTQSNNRNEQYVKEDKINIVDPINGDPYDKFYKFEGYQIFQMRDATTSVSDIENIDKARLVAQCDIVNGITTIKNFVYDEELGFAIGSIKVKGENKGIRHTFNIKEDLFAQGVTRLVNHKKYYYIAVAYAFNEYKKYDPNDPTYFDGQKMPYIASRINADGTAITPLEAIPHNPSPELGGTGQMVKYGTTPQITRIDGKGNGNRSLELTPNSLTEILTTGYSKTPTYAYGAGPLNVKVVDPLNLQGGYYVCKFSDYVNPGSDEFVNYRGTDTASWTIYRYDKEGGNLLDQVSSERTIANQNEQIIAKWGISVDIKQVEYFRADKPEEIQGLSIEGKRYTQPIGATLTFKDSSKRWLSFIEDNDFFFPTNWIRSGIYKAVGDDTITRNPAYLSPYLYNDETTRDVDKSYSKLLSGGIAPHGLVGYKAEFSPVYYPVFTGALNAGNVTTIREKSSTSRAPSIDIVLTSDKSKWTRCAVIELGRNFELNVGKARPGTLRKSPSVDQNGNAIAGTGMGWFPGYAIDLESGMRLHMAFGENSFLASDGGADMIWNPSSRLTDNSGRPIMGGQQPIYVYGYNINGDGCPYYDPNSSDNWVYDQMAQGTNASYQRVYTSLTWVANPILTSGQKLLSNDAKISVRINKEYTEQTATGLNEGKPMYGWSMDDIKTVVGSRDRLVESLNLINVVPNPYYAFSQYETTRLDVRVKITNLPDKCDIKIYSINGKLIRSFKKDNPITSLDWDLKNNKGIPIASGVYLIHVEVEGVGETIVKFFGGIRQPDLENI